MPAIAEVLPTVASRPDPRGCDLPTCPVCADTMVAAEASAYLHDDAICVRGRIGCDEIGAEGHHQRKSNDDKPKQGSFVVQQTSTYMQPGIGH